jgi:uncharacterized OB-fold protein
MMPPLDADLATFWDGTREQQLLLPHCRSCSSVFWYPRPTCPRCLSADLEWTPSSGRGEVYAVSVMARSEDPYAVVLVDLDDGVRLMSNMVETDAADVRVGQRVELTWEALEDGRNLWLFRPGS